MSHAMQSINRDTGTSVPHAMDRLERRVEQLITPGVRTIAELPDASFKPMIELLNPYFRAYGDDSRNTEKLLKSLKRHGFEFEQLEELDHFASRVATLSMRTGIPTAELLGVASRLLHGARGPSERRKLAYSQFEVYAGILKASLERTVGKERSIAVFSASLAFAGVSAWELLVSATGHPGLLNPVVALFTCIGATGLAIAAGLSIRER
jgi:hypothetical protein